MEQEVIFMFVNKFALNKIWKKASCEFEDSFVGIKRSNWIYFVLQLQDTMRKGFLQTNKALSEIQRFVVGVGCSSVIDTKKSRIIWGGTA